MRDASSPARRRRSSLRPERSRTAAAHLSSTGVRLFSAGEGLGQGSDHRPIIAELVLRWEVARPLLTALFDAGQRFAGRQQSVIKA